MIKPIEEFLREHPEKYRAIQDSIAGSLVKLLWDGYIVVRESDGKMLSAKEIQELVCEPFQFDHIEVHDYDCKELLDSFNK